MDILKKLNSDFQIQIINGVAYDLQLDNEVIAKNKEELIQFYIGSFKYKLELAFDDDSETKTNYKNTIEKLNIIKESLGGVHNG